MKSNVSDYLELVHAVYIDACAKCTAEVSDLRDLETIKSRTEQEGMSFLTITLPSFARDFERSLADGFVDSKAFRNFRKARAIPAFLQGMLSRLFSQESGRILDYEDDSSTIVEAVRQICLLFKKIEMPCTPERDYAAIANFIQVEQVNSDFVLGPDLRDLFLRTSDVLWHNMLADLHPDMFIPRHGPGATADRISGNQKYVWRRWHERLEPFLPFFGSGYSVSATEDEELVEKVTFVPVDDEQPVRVVLVPKTLKTPRIIAIEPVCNQYAQQAIQRVLYERIESYWLTKGQVNFTDQTINQTMTLMASKDGSYATIDLSDASDRVLHELSLRMFDSNPFLRDFIDACRSRFAELPDGRLVGPLSKFASMGSALCFPVESMNFYTICVVALLVSRNLPVSPENVYTVSRDIFVYGDDLIVPTCDAVAVLDHLQKFNCKVNSNKTFYTGKFRESCGVDAYSGQLVTPTYIRKIVPENRRQASELLSWVATANHFYLRGYWRTASLMFCTCERILGSLPYVSPDSSGLGRISFLGFRSADSWNEDTQSLEQRAWVPSPVYRSDGVDGYPALQKCLSRLEEQSPSNYGPSEIYRWVGKDLVPFVLAEDHLERSARFGAVTLRRRGVPATLGRVMGS